MKSPSLLEIWKCFSKFITTSVECGYVEILKHMTNLNKKVYKIVLDPLANILWFY